MTDVFQTERSENKRKVRKLLVYHIFENEDKAGVLMLNWHCSLTLVSKEQNLVRDLFSECSIKHKF